MEGWKGNRRPQEWSPLLPIFQPSLCLITGVACLLAMAFAQTLGKFEPISGCYLGAFIEKDKVARGDYRKFEDLTKKKHASYFTYVGYGMPFPADWVAKVKSVGAAPHLAFEPNDGLSKVQDDDYLREWARNARAANCPVFLRFASEMNGNWTAYHDDPKLYIEKFRLVHGVMAHEAPNVAMVWTPFATLSDRMDLYYPGDRYVDWVGINIYSVYIHDGDARKIARDEDPIDYLRFLYRKYADRKPIHISEFAAAHYHKALGREVVDFAVEKMTRFYATIRRDFPRVKSINWFCMDTVDEKLADSNYSLLDDARKLSTYTTLVADNYFLSEVVQHPLAIAVAPVKPRPQLPVTQQALDQDADRALSNRGAVMMSVGGVILRGLENGKTYDLDSVQLVATVPPTVPVRFLIFEVDGGKLTRITNRAPFYFFIDRDVVGAGEHRVRVTVKDVEGKEHVSGEIKFRFAEKQ